MIRTLFIVAVAFAAIVPSAYADRQGIINQAGPFEATMQFYLHPAHGFPAVAEAVVASRVTPSGNTAAIRERPAQHAKKSFPATYVR